MRQRQHGNGPESVLNYRPRDLADNTFEMPQRSAGFHTIATRAELPHLGIPRIPERSGLGVQPQDSARSCVNAPQRVIAGVAVVGTAVPQDQYRRAVIDIM